MLPTREGRFKAAIGEHGVSETGSSHLATFVCQFRLTQELVNGQWEPIDEDWWIAGYFYLEKRDGSINEFAIEQLKEAFGWDGRDPFWLQDTDFDGRLVQVKLAFEQFNGQTRLKVQYVNPGDWAGAAVRKADDTARRSIQSRLGPKCRANAGPSVKGAALLAPAPPPPPPAPSELRLPAAQPGAPSKTPLPSTYTKERAWEDFIVLQGRSPRMSEGELQQLWFKAIQKVAGEKDESQLTPQEWERVGAEALPF